MTLGQTEAFERIIGGQKPDKLPLVLSAEEIERFLDAVTGLRNRVVLATAYAAGLWVSEVVRLKLSSIDSKRMLIHIENGKGGKDRYAMLFPAAAGYSSCVLDASTAGAVAISRPSAWVIRHGRGEPSASNGFDPQNPFLQQSQRDRIFRPEPFRPPVAIADERRSDAG